MVSDHPSDCVPRSACPLKCWYLFVNNSEEILVFHNSNHPANHTLTAAGQNVLANWEPRSPSQLKPALMLHNQTDQRASCILCATRTHSGAQGDFEQIALREGAEHMETSGY